MTRRQITEVIPAQEVSDGAGVKLRRSLGLNGARLDPFLMLDEFASDNPKDYIAGFPSHPHRGFETVTYLLAGHMLHEDHLGNHGNLQSGGVQWMTAGRGIVHSEMPQQDDGLLHGFQLWLNLPAKEKMQPANYRDIAPQEQPVAHHDGAHVKVIAGSVQLSDGTEIRGPVNGDRARSTDPVIIDVLLDPGAEFEQSLHPAANVFVYPYEGSVWVDSQQVDAHTVGVFGPGERIALSARGASARALLIAGKPIGEPIVQYGPFVMNTRAEIDEALADYRSGRLTKVA